MRYIIVGKSSYQTFNKCYKFEPGDYYIGLDDGTFTILDSGYLPNEAWGDFDTSNRIQELKDQNVLLKKFKAEKNETDLELVLMNRAFESEILIYDVTGGRLDHELINMLLLRKYKNLNIKIIDEQNEIRFLSVPGTYLFKQDGYKYISVITLDEAVISETKGKYLLEHVRITKNDTYTISNEFDNGEFELKLLNGGVILIRSI